MTIKKVIEIIPERKIEKSIYVAKDGTEFFSESQCSNYEEQLDVFNHPVFKNSIKGFRTLDEDLQMKLFYVSCDSNYSYLESKIGITYSNYEIYGPGWYMSWVVDGGDYDDSVYLWHFESYVNERKKRNRTVYRRNS